LRFSSWASTFWLMRTLILDNHDSFTYNLFQYVAQLDGEPVVKKNDEISLKEIEHNNFSHIIISPGPGTPEKKEDFGICADVIKKFANKLPILGVCLGHQGIVHAFGGKIIAAPQPVHGKKSRIEILERDGIFARLPRYINAMRYHSLVARQKDFPPELVVTARTVDDNLIMACRHEKYPLWGVQFHPESFETPCGKTIIKNFLGSLDS